MGNSRWTHNICLRMDMDFLVTTFYKFVRIPESALEGLKAKILAEAKKLNMGGLILLSEEGCNATVCGKSEDTEEFKSFLVGLAEIGELNFSDTKTHKQSFKRFKVDLRPEIVNLGFGEKFSPLKEQTLSATHLSPEEWEAVLNDPNQEFSLIDVRNDYEFKIGSFKGSINPQTEMFTEFDDYVDNCGIPKDRKVLMFCTGGIRCEKASLLMKAKGYKDVAQLKGGIINYLRQFPESNFDGECFIFDNRVALDQKLEPSKVYRLCPHCGNPGREKIVCKNCEKVCQVCETCNQIESKQSCSKNCAHHLALRLEAGVA